MRRREGFEPVEAQPLRDLGATTGNFGVHLTIGLPAVAHTPASELERHEDVLAPVAVAVRAARGRGLSLQSVLSYVRLMETLRQFRQAVVPESMRRLARQERARRAEEGNN